MGYNSAIMMIEGQDIRKMLLNPPTPISAPISQDLGFSIQDKACDGLRLINSCEYIDYEGSHFMKITLNPDLRAFNIDTRSITRGLLEEQGLKLSRSNVKYIEKQIFGEPGKQQTDLIVSLNEGGEIRVFTKNGEEILLNRFSLIYNFEEHGEESGDINACLSGGALTALAIYGGIQSLRERGKRRRDSHRPIAIAPKKGTVNLGTVGDGEKPTPVEVKMPPLGSITEKNIGNIDFMAEPRKKERARQDRNAAAWKEIDDLGKFDIVSRIEEENAQIKAQIEPGWKSYGNGLVTVVEGGRVVCFIDPKHPEYGERPVTLTEAQRNDPKTIKWLKTLIPQK